MANRNILSAAAASHHFFSYFFLHFFKYRWSHRVHIYGLASILVRHQTSLETGGDLFLGLRGCHVTCLLSVGSRMRRGNYLLTSASGRHAIICSLQVLGMGDGGLLVWEQLPAIRLILLTLYWAYFRKTRTRAGIDGHHEKKRPRVGGKKKNNPENRTLNVRN